MLKIILSYENYDKGIRLMINAKKSLNFNSIESALDFLSSSCQCCSALKFWQPLQIESDTWRIESSVSLCHKCLERVKNSENIIITHNKKNVDLDKLVDLTSSDSFPASDPPAWAMGEWRECENK